MISTDKNINNEMPSRFVFHEDAGHGWLEVPYRAIVALNIQNKISGYSYRKDDMIYLEEDCDATLFIKRYLLNIGKKESDYQSFKSVCTSVYDGESSFIRNYPHYRKSD